MGGGRCAFFLIGNKMRKHNVHISIEVKYKIGEKSIHLLPGQVIPFPIVPREGIPEEWKNLGRAEITVYASLWEGDRVYTNLSSSPLSKEYILREQMEGYGTGHATYGGFGATHLYLDGPVPGVFGHKERWTGSYPLELILKHDEEARFERGPACAMHLVPETYLKLTKYASPLPGDVRLYDVFSREVCTFRRLGLPIILGEFDGLCGRETRWQKVVLEEYLSPLANRGYKTFGIVSCLRDPKTGETNQGKKGPYEKYVAYLAYRIPSPPNEVVTYSQPLPRPMFIAPYDRGDILAPLDLGRSRIHTWVREAQEMGR